jgi:hypothetical protein
MYHKESAKEAKERSIVKNNSPSPTSYNVQVSEEKTQINNKNNFFRIGKSVKSTFADRVIKRGKKLPGVGQYKTENAIDNKIARPMGKPRAC